MNDFLYPPSFIDGLRPQDLLATADGQELLALYDQELATTIALLRHQRSQLTQLLDGQAEPGDDEQRDFLARAWHGTPVSLGADGEVEPVLVKGDGGWRCEFEGNATTSYATVAGCLQAYSEMVWVE